MDGMEFNLWTMWRSGPPKKIQNPKRKERSWKQDLVQLLYTCLVGSLQIQIQGPEHIFWKSVAPKELVQISSAPVRQWHPTKNPTVHVQGCSGFEFARRCKLYRIILSTSVPLLAEYPCKKTIGILGAKNDSFYERNSETWTALWGQGQATSQLLWFIRFFFPNDWEMNKKRDDFTWQEVNNTSQFTDLQSTTHMTKGNQLSCHALLTFQPLWVT